MNPLKIALLFVCLATVLPSFADTKPVTLEQVTQYVATQNYFVLENAQRVYQAKQSIQLARRNLLPRLNIWNIIEAPSNPMSLLGLVEDIAPFLVPSNWLRVKEERLFNEATRHGYKSLLGNEVLTARGLVYQSHLEERMADTFHNNAAALSEVYQIVRSREAMAALPAGSAQQVEIQLLSVQSDALNLKKLTKENRNQLAFLLGFSGNDEAVATGIKYIPLNENVPLVYSDYEALVLDASPELKQFSALIEAAKHVRRERYYSFLGVSSMSRGVSGGVFDNLPQQDGLGFGVGPSVRIVRSQQDILKLQKTAISETIRKSLKQLVDSYNIDLEMRRDAVRRVSISQKYYGALLARMKMGDVIDAFEIVQAIKSMNEAQSSYHTTETRLLLAKDRLSRLIFIEAFKLDSETVK